MTKAIFFDTWAKNKSKKMGDKNMAKSIFFDTCGRQVQKRGFLLW